MKQKERIDKMEKILNNSTKLLEELEEILNKLDKDSKNYNELVKYYYSKNWAKDKEDAYDKQRKVDAKNLDKDYEKTKINRRDKVDDLPDAKVIKENPPVQDELYINHRK